jgi:hypothetical protein
MPRNIRISETKGSSAVSIGGVRPGSNTRSSDSNITRGTSPSVTCRKAAAAPTQTGMYLYYCPSDMEVLSH